jgi:hypothetical protein
MREDPQQKPRSPSIRQVRTAEIAIGEYEAIVRVRKRAMKLRDADKIPTGRNLSTSLRHRVD